MDDPSTSGVTEEFGLMFYNTRWYDPALGRFAQADSIVPPGVQGLDRYAYVNNSPMMYTDPSGHWPDIPNASRCGPDNIHCGGLYGNGSLWDQFQNSNCPSTVCQSPYMREITIIRDTKELLLEIEEKIDLLQKELQDLDGVPLTKNEPNGSNEPADIPQINNAPDPEDYLPKIPFKPTPKIPHGGGGGNTDHLFLID